MPRQRKSKPPSSPSPSPASAIPLSHPPSQPAARDRRPSDETLFKLAEKRGLFREPPQPRPEDVLSPGEERLAEAGLWTFVLAMLHFTLDVLAQNQYAMEINFRTVTMRTARAWLVLFMLFYFLHPHRANNKTLVPGLPPQHQHPLRQALFLAASVAAGCRMIYVTNSAGYMAVMKQAPPLGCLWLWAVVELDLPWAALSLAVAGGFLWLGGFTVM